jgi:hypothetical protein
MQGDDQAAAEKAKAKYEKFGGWEASATKALNNNDALNTVKSSIGKVSGAFGLGDMTKEGGAFGTATKPITAPFTYFANKNADNFKKEEKEYWKAHPISTAEQAKLNATGNANGIKNVLTNSEYQKSLVGTFEAKSASLKGKLDGVVNGDLSEKDRKAQLDELYDDMKKEGLSGNAEESKDVLTQINGNIVKLNSAKNALKHAEPGEDTSPIQAKIKEYESEIGKLTNKFNANVDTAKNDAISYINNPNVDVNVQVKQAVEGTIKADAAMGKVVQDAVDKEFAKVKEALAIKAKEQANADNIGKAVSGALKPALDKINANVSETKKLAESASKSAAKAAKKK